MKTTEDAHIRLRAWENCPNQPERLKHQWVKQRYGLTVADRLYDPDYDPADPAEIAFRMASALGFDVDRGDDDYSKVPSWCEMEEKARDLLKEHQKTARQDEQGAEKGQPK